MQANTKIEALFLGIEEQNISNLPEINLKQFGTHNEYQSIVLACAPSQTWRDQMSQFLSETKSMSHYLLTFVLNLSWITQKFTCK